MRGCLGQDTDGAAHLSIVGRKHPEEYRPLHGSRARGSLGSRWRLARTTQEGRELPRSDVMSDTPGDALRKAPASPPPVKPPDDDDDAVNLLDGSVEPTDDSPTVIS